MGKKAVEDAAAVEKGTPTYKPDRGRKGLSARQRRFIAECVGGASATQAAIRAGYSPKTARSIACENLTKPAIKEEIERLLAPLIVPPERVAQELQCAALLQPKDLVDENGQMIPLQKLPDDAARAIASIKRFPDGSLELRFSNKNAACVALGRFYKLLGERKAANSRRLFGEIQDELDREEREKARDSLQ